ncbi:MAG: DUF3604 domain-containing protein [Deltaproteobacteria bacterium]|nr:DUF3604 domain-containing protein [Deltaproteobacteria bacterium]
MRQFTLALLCLAFSASAAPAAERAACASSDPLRRPFFGDTHVHTAFSFDASSQDTRNTPRDAYRFAKGQRLGLQPYDERGRAQRSARLRRPLDFAVVTDHAEGLGEVRICRDPEQPGHEGDFCWMYRNFGPLAFNVMAIRTIIARDRFAFCGEDDRRCLEQAAVVWGEIQAAAEEAYDRSSACSFSSFIGYEWTASTAGGGNLHRNVIFKNAKVPAYPPSWVETPSAFALWERLQRDCIEGTPGCDALTIPHNSNLSGPGLIFESARLTADAKKRRVNREEARMRQRWEPLVEIMQHKGDSECLLGGDTKDEACAFEKLPYASFAGVGRFRQLNLSGAAADTGPQRSATVREALKKGLVLQRRLGVNPLRYGIVASTDTHLGTPGLATEDGAAGHGGAGMQGGGAVGLPDNLEFNPGGLAVLWAEENTRESLFAAMQRREAYGTSGTRPVVRMFGGWNYPQNMCSAPDFVARGYQGGVPMGGDLPAPPENADGAAPRLAVWALQDPGSARQPGTPLERVQIVKGWIERGKARERVFDIAGGDGDASVDPATCEQRGGGAKQLCAVWQDPDFDPGAGAFYYARVLENPSCRWSQRLCTAAKVNCAAPDTVPPEYAGCCAPDHRPAIRERAWTSPIWFTPE